MKKQVHLLSGSPELRRFLVQKCLNYAAMFPLDTRWAMQEFAWCCSIIGVQLIADANGIWLEPISFKKTELKTLFVISQEDDNQVVGAVNVDDTCEEVSFVKIEFDEDGDIKVTQIDREIIIVPLSALSLPVSSWYLTERQPNSLLQEITCPISLTCQTGGD